LVWLGELVAKEDPRDMNVSSGWHGLRMSATYARFAAIDRAAKLLLTGGYRPQLWDLTAGRLLRELPVTGFQGHYADWAVGLTPDGGRAVASYSDRSVRFWDTANGEEVFRWQADGVATGMAVTGDRVLVGEQWSKQLLLYDLATGTELFRAKTRTSGTTTVAISDDGRFGLSGGGDKKVHLWDLAVGRQVAELAGHTGRVHCLRFGPGGTTAVSCGSDKTVRVWDLTNGRELKSFPYHSRIVDCVAFAPDGQSVASGGRDLTARVWHLTDGREQCFHGHSTNPTTLAFRLDSRTLVSVGCQDVWTWDLTAPPD
jgi:WD40 repeat protein